MKKMSLLLGSICLILTCASVSFASGTVKIGALFAVTGPASFLGEPEKRTGAVVNRPVLAAVRAAGAGIGGNLGNGNGHAAPGVDRHPTAAAGRRSVDSIPTVSRDAAAATQSSHV